MNSYWFGTGTQTYLIEMLRRYDVIPQQIKGRKCVSADFDAPTEHMTDITPLLYQSGYIDQGLFCFLGTLYTQYTQ